MTGAGYERREIVGLDDRPAVQPGEAVRGQVDGEIRRGLIRAGKAPDLGLDGHGHRPRRARPEPLRDGVPSLKMSTAPSDPAVVSVTSLVVVASSFVITPNGWLEPVPVAVVDAMMSR